MKFNLIIISILITQILSLKAYSQELYNARTIKAGIFLGGQYKSFEVDGFLYSPDKEYRKGIELGINAEYFVIDYYSLGLNVSFSNYSEKKVSYDSVQEIEYFNNIFKTNKLNLSIGNKYYFKINNNFFIPIELPIGISTGTFKFVNERIVNSSRFESHSEFDNINFYSSLRSGLSYVIKSKFELNISCPLILFNSSYTKGQNETIKSYYLERSEFNFLGQSTSVLNPINISFSYIIN